MAYELVQAMLEAEYHSNGHQYRELYRDGMRHAASHTPDEWCFAAEYYRTHPDDTPGAAAYLRGYFALADAVEKHEREQPHGLHPS